MGYATVLPTNLVYTAVLASLALSFASLVMAFIPAKMLASPGMGTAFLVVSLTMGIVIAAQSLSQDYESPILKYFFATTGTSGVAIMLVALVFSKRYPSYWQPLEVSALGLVGRRYGVLVAFAPLTLVLVL
jgi:hypothetical protein